MSVPSASHQVKTLVGKVYAVRPKLKEAAHDNLIEPLSKAVEALSGARRHWANKVRDYSRSASDNSDEWAESHLYLIAAIGAAIGAGVGLVLGVFFALP